MTAQQKFTSFASVLSKSLIRRTALVFLVALVSVTFMSLVVVYRQSSQNAMSSLNNSRLEIESVLSDVESIASALSMAMPDKNVNDQVLTRTSRSVVASDPRYVTCAVAFEPGKFNKKEKYHMIMSSKDTLGNITTEILGGEQFDYFYQDWYQIPKLTGKPYWNEPSYILSGASTMTVSYSTPLYNSKGEFIGVSRIDVDIAWLSTMTDKFKPYKSAATIIVSRAGSFVTHPDRFRCLNETIYTDAISTNNKAGILKCQNVMSGASGHAAYPADGIMRYVVYQPLSNGWSIMGICSFNDFYKPVKDINIVLFLIAILGLFVLYISCQKLIRRLTKNITELTYVAMNMSRGNFHVSIPPSNDNGEIHLLTLSMRYLRDTINEYISRLKTATIKQERIESELAIASSIQTAFLPHTFESDPRVEYYGSISPAKEVGGDLFDVRRQGDFLFFAIGDVSGKGVPAALFMALTKSAFGFLNGMKLPVAEIVSRVNSVFAEGNEDGMFVTLFVAVVNLNTHEMEYCNGGHNPIVVISPDGTAKYLKAKPNLAAGLFPEFEYESEKIQLEKGCRIIAYTDGVSEAETAQKELFGEDRLLDFASSVPAGASSQEVVESLFDCVHKFTDGNDQNDDITVFSVKFN